MHTFIKLTIQVLILAITLFLLTGCSKPTGITDAQLAADTQIITNVIIKNGQIFKNAEAGQLGSQVSIPIDIGANSDQQHQRHYIATWKDSTWRISQTNKSLMVPFTNK